VRNQYKVLAEKYNLVSEGTPKWDIQPTDNWYEVFEAYKLPHFKEFIYWLNNYSKEWARNEMFGDDHFNTLHMDNVDDLIDHIYDHKYSYVGDDPDFADRLKIDDEEDDEEDTHPLQHEIAVRNTVEEVYDLAFLPWYKERQAALNKDNPGIEMDI